jgi:hypothetical protein
LFVAFAADLMLDKFRWITPDIALVSHGVPPGMTGYHFMLEQLLGAIPEKRLATVGVGGPWASRPHVPFPAGRTAPGRRTAHAVATAVGLAERLAPYVYPRMLPNVRKIFATLDPTLGVATAWAKATGAELWLYAIDLHADGYWNVGGFRRSRLLAWRGEALRMAHRVLAISEPMAEWMRSGGVTANIDIVPPLYPVGDRAPYPEGPVTFLMCGAVYSINAAPLRWLEKAVTDLAPSARLRLVTTTPDSEIQRLGLNLARWTKAQVSPRDVPAEVVRATWGVMGCDSGQSVDGQTVVWPTKLREFFGLGRPLLCIARPENAIARQAINSRWGLFAFGEEQTREAVQRIVSESRADLEERCRAAHAFALERMNDATIGARIRRELCELAV